MFNKKQSERLPEHRPWDHAINLKPDFEPPKNCKIYPLAPVEQKELDSFIEENLRKGYIRPSKSPMASPFFFVKKKDGSFCPVQDYRALNKGTIKNQYLLPLIPKLINKLKGARYFTKGNVRHAYNNVRIKEGHKPSRVPHKSDSSLTRTRGRKYLPPNPGTSAPGLEFFQDP